jgi:DNA-binding transcriptional regulator YiaG
MNALLQEVPTTAGGWPSFVARAGATILVSAFLAAPSGATSANNSSGEATPRRFCAPQTNAGFVLQQRERKRAAEGILELRQMTSLTWDQLARLFNVSRRALHFWASGQTMSADHEERFYRIASCIQKAYTGNAVDTRAALLRPDADGAIPFDLLAEGKYDEALALLAPQSDAPVVRRAPRVVERPAEWKPEQLVDALQDRIPAYGTPKPSTRRRVRLGSA